MSTTTLPDPPRMLFHRLRWNLLRNSSRVILGQGAVRPVTIVLCSLVVVFFVFGLSMGGFRLVRDQGVALTGDLVGILFDFLFLALTVLLVFSTGLILYGSLFGSAESAFLLSKPVPADRVFAHKFQGAVGFSSWAFLLLGGPILVAFGLVFHAPWGFYALLPLFFLGFVLVPGSVGALLCLLIVNYVPKRRKQFLALLTVALTLLAGWWVYQTVVSARSADQNREMLTRLWTQLAFVRWGMLPSHWIALGLREAARADWARAGYHLALVWSNGLFLYLIAAMLSRRLYRRGFNRLATGGDLKRKFGGLWMDRLLAGSLPFVDPRTRTLIVKDFRTFRRDPQQWAQVLIFTVLMGLYVTNVRRLFPGEVSWTYQNSISLLNLCATSLLLCTYTGRFVYPLLSLEGRKFWILGLLPLERERLLWGKFAFATLGALVIAELLVLLSDVAIGMPVGVIVLHAVTVAALAVGLSGLSVGLGAMMPNFRETDPSKIAVGFGGTMNLLVGLLFLAVEISLMTLPWHLQVAFQESPSLSVLGFSFVLVGMGVGVVVGALAGVLPLVFGARALRRMEF